MLTDERRSRRQQQAKPLTDALHQWMLAQRQRVPEGSTIARKLDYCLKRWEALTRYLDDGLIPIDNNHIERQIRWWPLAARTGCLPALCARANGPPLS